MSTQIPENTVAACEDTLPYAALVYLLKDDDGQEEVIPLCKSPFTIGRTGENNLSVPIPFISASHAQITYKNGVWILENTKGRRGTWVNGTQITDPYILQEGDLIGLFQFYSYWRFTMQPPL